ncbi:MAG: hypothetical protein ACXWT4_13975 [Methylobacter sp.]
MIDSLKNRDIFSGQPIGGCLLSISFRKLLFAGCLLINTAHQVSAA